MTILAVVLLVLVFIGLLMCLSGDEFLVPIGAIVCILVMCVSVPMWLGVI